MTGGTARRALLAAGAFLLAAPGSFPAAATAGRAPDARAPGAGRHSLTVFAAASLAGALGEVARGLERDHPGSRVRINVAGSQKLSAQIEQGLEADVFASADEAWMRRVAAMGRVSGAPAPFATNHPVVIVSRTHGDRVRSPADLAAPGVKLVLGGPAVPIGRYGREALRRLAALPGYPPDFLDRALANVVSEEEDVNGVAGKVRLGEADAGVVYGSDVTPALAPHVRVLEFPGAAAVTATCWIAVLRGRHEAAAAEFVSRVRSDPGRRALAARGFTPLGGP